MASGERSQLHGLVLARTLIAEPLARELPDLLHSAAPVHATQHQVCGRRDAEELAGLVILQHVPGLAARALAVNLRVRPQPRLEVGDAIPIAGKRAHTSARFRSS
jgi:hypothetical protein